MPGPLTGLRVVELAGIGPAPVACRILCDLGADVVRVERPGQEPDAAAPVSLRGRRTVVLDLKADAGREQLRELVAAADVLIDPFRPGVAERLGVGPDECLAGNAGLVYARMTGWGQTGPWAMTAGHDIGYIALTGALGGIGRAGGPPQVPLNLLGDFGGGSMFLVTGILSALWERERSGQGQVVDVSITDGTTVLTGFIHGMRAQGHWPGGRGENLLDTGVPWYDVYETADARWVSVGALEPQFYAQLLAGLGLEQLPDRGDEVHWPAIRAAFTERFRGRTQREWGEVFDGTDACVVPVLTWAEAAGHPQLAARGTLTVVDGVSQPAPAPRFSRTPGALPPKQIPCAAEDVLRGWARRPGA